MPSKFESLAEKVEKVLALLDKVKGENALLKQENAELRVEMTGIKKECRQLRLGSADQSEAAKSRLTSVLSRLEELESLHQ
jgi:regulator of replication initiation timing